MVCDTGTIIEVFRYHQHLKIMDPKKASQVSLENRRLTNTIVGLIVSLSLILISFEWTTPEQQMSRLDAAREIEFDMEEVALIPRDEPKPEPKEKLPAVKVVIDIVPDDVEIEDVEFIVEVTDDTEYEYWTNDSNGTEFVEETIPFVLVQDKPEFNGGDPKTEFAKYIAKHVQYPAIALENHVYGMVVVQFVIDQNGNLTDPVILRSVDPALDAEALRVISASPRWTPGKQRNRSVRVTYQFPINFVLH
jgi:periplasmic protein TonB